MPAIAFYISGHGFGHVSRQIEIINALAPRLPPDVRIVIRTAAARWLFDRTLTTPTALIDNPCDSGIVQIDSLRPDEAATVGAAADFYSTFDERAAAEAALLREHGAVLVISDAPPLACAAAAAAAIPSIVISNFTWDWIYAGYAEQFAAGAPEVIPTIRSAYALAAAGWRLPMHGGFDTIDVVLNLPFVARHARPGRTRDQVLRRFSIAPGRPVALVSFGGYGLESFDPATLDCLDSWTVVLTGHDAPTGQTPGVAFVNEGDMYAAGFRYEDLVAAADVVVTKPGYGIVSECVANGTAMLYTSRGRFVEYDVMVREMPAVLRCAHIDQESLLAGRWRVALDALLLSPAPPQRPRTDGARITALMIAAAAGLPDR